MAEIEVKPEHAGDPNTRRVGIMVGVVGILLSVVTIAGHRAHTQAVIHRTESNDQWAYYQAKKIREYTSEVTVSVLQTLAADPAKTAAPVQKLNAARDKYAADAEKIQEDAKRKDEESDLEERRALPFSRFSACAPPRPALCWGSWASCFDETTRYRLRSPRSGSHVGDGACSRRGACGPRCGANRGLAAGGNAFGRPARRRAGARQSDDDSPQPIARQRTGAGRGGDRGAARRRAPGRRRDRRKLHARDPGTCRPGLGRGGISGRAGGRASEPQGNIADRLRRRAAGGQERRPATRMVGAQFRRVHRLPVAGIAPPEGLQALEALHGLPQGLKSLDAGDVVERQRESDVQYVAEAGAGIAETQTEPHVPQQPRVAVADDAVAPGPAYVRENGASHPHQSKRVPIGIEALLHR